MAIFSLDDLRRHYGANGQGKTDEQLLQDYAPRVGMDPIALADKLGYDNGSSGSKTGERTSSAVDSYQSNLYGVLGAGARAVGADRVGDWANQRRDANDFQSKVADKRAQDLGAVSRFTDDPETGKGGVHSMSDFGDYAAGLAIQSAPAMAEMGATALTGGAIAPLTLGLRGARTAEMIAAAERATKIGRTVGAVAGDYPVAMGDILQNQREQNGGENFGAAALGAAPYVAIDVGTGVGKYIGAGKLARNTSRVLDEATGLTGGLKRMGATALKTGAEEGAGELGQEFINQYAGRMAVDPNETFINDKSMDRYKESLIGGAVLGGAFGGAGGGWRRSEGFKPTVDQAPDLLDRGSSTPPASGEWTTSRGFEPAPPKDDVASALGDTSPEWTTSRGFEPRQGGLDASSMYPAVGEAPATTGNPRAPLEIPAVPGRPDLPDTMIAGGPSSQVAGTDPSVAAMTDPGTLAAIEQQRAQREAQAEQQRAIDQSAQAAFAKQRLVEDTIGGERDQEGKLVKKIPQRVVDVFHALNAAKEAGAVSPAEFAEQAGYLKAGVPGDVQKVRKFVEAKVNAQPNVSAAPGVAEPAPVGRGDQPGGSVGTVGRVAPDATGGVVGPADAAPRSSPADEAVGVEPRGATAAVADAPKPKYTKAPKPNEKPVAKPRVAAPAAPAPTKFDNIPDLADAVAKENGLTPEHATAYVDSVVMGRSMSKIATDLGVGKSTVGDMVKKMRELVDQNKFLRLEAGAENEGAHVNDELAAHTEASVAPETDEHVEQSEDTGEVDGQGEGLSRHGDEAIRVNDEGEVDVSGDPAQTGVSVRGSMDAGGETKAHNDQTAEAQYKKALKGDEGALKEQWNHFNQELDEKQRVKWEDLGPGQRAWFGEEFKNGDGKQGHTSVTTSVNDDAMRFATRSDFVLPGSTGTLAGVSKPVTPAVMAGARQALMPVKFPQLFAQKVAAKVSDGRGGQYSYGPLTDAHRAVVGSAMENLSQSVVGPFYKIASPLVARVVAFEPTPLQKHTGGAFISGQRTLMLNAANISTDLTAHDHVTETTVAHELYHALDSDAGRLLGTQLEASALPNSPTLSKVNIDLAQGVVSMTHNPVMIEALKAYQKNPAKWQVLNQSLAPLFDQMGQAFKADLKIGGFDLGRLENAADTATAELGPKLMELYASSPGLLKELPLAYAHAEAIANAKSLREAAQILGGLDGRATQQRGNEGLVRQSDAAGPARQRDVQPVRGEVQGNPALRGAPHDGVVPEGNRSIRENRGTAPATNPAEGVGHQDQLTPPPLGAPGKLKAWLGSLTGDKLYRNHPGVLGWLTTEQLATAFPKLDPVAAYSHAMQHMGGAATHMMNASDAIARAWHKAKSQLGLTEAARFDALINDSTRTQVWPNKPLAEQTHLDVTDPKVIAAHADLEARWKSTPAAYKEIFNATQADHRARFDRYVAAQKAMIMQSNYPAAGSSAAVPSKALIDQAAALKKSERDAFMADHATTKLASDTYRSLFDGLDAQAKLSQLVGPYAPQARFGDHIVHYKTTEFLDAEHALETATAELQRLHEADNYAPIADLDSSIAQDTAKLKRASNTERVAQLTADIADAKAERAKLVAPFDAAKALVAERTEKLNALKADQSAYNVEFFENRGQAVQREAQLKAFFGDDGTAVTRTLRDQYLTSTDGITPAHIKKIEEHLTHSLSGADAQEVRRTVREMYLQHLPGTSALKSQIKRRNVPGIKDSDALRSFSNKAMRDAYAISRAEHAPTLQDHLDTLRGSTDEDAKIVGNELAKRIAQNFTLKTSKAISLATNATYMSTLGLSPGFMLIQGTQQWINTAPVMAARHGMATINLLKQGTVDAAKLLKVSFNQSKDKMNFGVDIPAGVKAGIITEDEGALLKDMFDRGRIDITTAHDLGISGAGRDAGVLAHAAQMANWPVQQLEVINRISTALAGFRAEKASGIKGGLEPSDVQQRAMKYADKLVSETHMNYNSENRARFLHPNNWGGWGRVMYQFRAYQQGMAYLTIKNLVDGMRGDKEAMRAVGYLAGVQLATAGAAGLPIPGAMVVAASMMYKAWKDDDDEQDLKEMFFQGIKSVGGETMARLVTKGVPGALGVDLSTRIGMGNIFDVAPFARNQKDGRDMVAAYWMAATAGPAGGQVANYAEALHQASSGDFVKAATFMLPKAAADVVRAASYETQGLKDSRGNPILRPEDISAGATALRLFGLQSEDLARTYDQRTGFFAARQARNDARAKLLRQYANATIEGGDTGSVREKIVEFNSRHPDDRIAPGALPVAVQKRREAERNMRNGVPVGKRDRALAADLGVE